MANQPEGIVFEVHVDRGAITGKTWHGKFRAKTVLSFAEQMRIDRLKRDLLGPGTYEGADPEVIAQATILSELQVRITEAPEWWHGGIDHADPNLLMSVYDGANKIRDEYMAEILKQGEAAQAVLRDEFHQPAATPTPRPPASSVGG